MNRASKHDTISISSVPASPQQGLNYWREREREKTSVFHPHTINHTYSTHHTSYTTHHHTHTITHTPHIIHHTPYSTHHTPYTTDHTPYTTHHTSMPVDGFTGCCWLEKEGRKDGHTDTALAKRQTDTISSLPPCRSFHHRLNTSQIIKYTKY